MTKRLNYIWRIAEKKGFTVIQTVILDELDDMDVSSNGEPKLIDGNIDKPAPGYFTHVDKVISLAAAKGLYIALLPTWGDKVDKQWGKRTGDFYTGKCI